MVQAHPSLYTVAEQHSSVKLSYYYNTTQITIGSLPIIENNENLNYQMSLFSNWDSIENSIFNISLHELSLIPEFFLAFTAVILIIHCSLIAYSKRYNSILLQFSVTSLCILIVFLTFLLYFHEAYVAVKYLSFEFSFLSDSLGFLSKIITVAASLVCMYLLQDYIIEYKINSTEYDLLMLYAILGLTMLITANDFVTIFLALELQSLSLYMLSGFKKNSIYSIESGLKYFILGGLSTSYFLLGSSLLYGISGLFVLLGFHFFLFSDFSNFPDLLIESGGEEMTDIMEVFSVLRGISTVPQALEKDMSIFRYSNVSSNPSEATLVVRPEPIFLPRSCYGSKSSPYLNDELGEVLRGGLLMVEYLATPEQLGTQAWPLLRRYQITLKKFFYFLGFRPDSENPHHEGLSLTADELAMPVLNTEQLARLAFEFRRRSYLASQAFFPSISQSAWLGLALLTEEMIHDHHEVNSQAYIEYFANAVGRRANEHRELRFFNFWVRAIKGVPGAADPERIRQERNDLIVTCATVALVVPCIALFSLILRDAFK